MKRPYDIFISYLPPKTSTKYPQNPILYICEEYTENIYAVYSFDKTKKVLLISDYNHNHFRYMSLYEFMINNWKILENDELYLILNKNELDIDTLPF